MTAPRARARRENPYRLLESVPVCRESTQVRANWRHLRTRNIRARKGQEGGNASPKSGRPRPVVRGRERERERERGYARPSSQRNGVKSQRLASALEIGTTLVSARGAVASLRHPHRVRDVRAAPSVSFPLRRRSRPTRMRKNIRRRYPRRIVPACSHCFPEAAGTIRRGNAPRSHPVRMKFQTCSSSTETSPCAR